MKPLVIYHADCTDGFGAAFAAWLKLGDEAEYLPMNYNSINPADLADLTDARDVYILDFSLPRAQMDSLFTNAKRVVWLDHHKTAFEMWCQHRPEAIEQGYYCKGWGDENTGADFVLLDNNKSGALLAWEYFHPDTEVPMLVKHIDDRDRWQFKLEGSKELHAALQSYKPWSFEQWGSKFWPNGGRMPELWNQTQRYSDLIKEGASILRAQDAHVKSMVKQARKCKVMPSGNTFVGWDGLAVNASLHQSEAGHKLANQSGTYGLVWYVAADGRVNASLRSNGDYDVSAIAKSFGGGGHRNSAGFQTDINTLMGWLK